ncbi:MAG: deoxyribodipyrimidine photo-lyase [Planctomycetota bacterium]
MRAQPVHQERIERLNDHPPRNRKYVLYWMQQSQRADLNHALEYAIGRANEIKQPLLVVFGLMDDYPEANERHYRFMLAGLQETQRELKERGIRMAIQVGSPDEVALQAARDASLVVCDRGYLRHQKGWRKHVAMAVDCEMVQVESDVVVPVETVSDHAEFAARTIRPKIHRLWNKFLVPLKREELKKDSRDIAYTSETLTDIDRLVRDLRLDRGVAPVHRWFRGGSGEAKRTLRSFCRDLYHDYARNRNQPQTENVSHMSKYLHFGQISPIEVALAARDAPGEKENEEDFLEELIVRRELAQNFVHFTANYDRFQCLPRWAKESLREHKADHRNPVYSRADLEAAETDDAYWNAAMREMTRTGYMHNYMRMYWGKKILEWSRSPEYAFKTVLSLNNKYFLDGRDPNSFASVAWVFGLHDRAFAERPIYGKVRYMSADGLKRKCDIEGYVDKVNRLVS